MKIQVVRSQPNPDQCGIDHIVGHEFDATVDDQGRAFVNCKEFDGQIILNSSEWRHVLPPKPSEVA